MRSRSEGWCAPDRAHDHRDADSAGANVEKTGPLGHPDEEAQAARWLCNALRHLMTTALLATPPPADFTQTVVGARLVLPRNAQRPSAALTAVVAMRAPGQVVPTAPPLWISTLAAKLPAEVRLLVPSTRSCVPARPPRPMRTVSAPAAGGGAGAGAAFTTCVTAAEVLARKSSSPL